MIRTRQTLWIAAVAMVLSIAASACGSKEVEPLAPPPELQAGSAPAQAPATAVAEAAPSTTAAKPVAETAPGPPSQPELFKAVTTAGEVAPESRTGRTGDEELVPELTGITGWINSEPFTLESHRGKVVLVDFWTYTCINCIRTLPYLKEWYEKYTDKGLVILGVHTPEFEFEKIRENVVQYGAEKFELKYAIAQDNDYGTWNAFSNRFWPAKYLVDKDGYVRYTHFGEGKYQETEEKIRELLSESGSSVGQIVINEEPERIIHPEAQTSDRSKGVTRELYAGLSRNLSNLQQMSMGSPPPYIIQEQYYQTAGTDVLYEDLFDHENHFLYLHGLWRNTQESLIHARDTTEFEDYLGVRFYASSVNVVMGPEGEVPIEVRVTIDGASVGSEQAGADITYDDDGNSYVLVDEFRMYRLVKLMEFEGHELKISSNMADLGVYAYTFGAYVN